MYSMIHWLATILLFLGTVWFIEFLPLHFAALIPLILLTLYELIVFCKSGLSHFASFQNMFDLLCYGCSYGLIIPFNILNLVEENNEYRILFSQVTLLLMGFRSIMHLRVI